VGGFILFAFGAPAFLTGGPIFGEVGSAFRPLAWFWFGMCSFAAAMSALRSFLVRRKFDLGLKNLESIQNLSWQQFEVMIGEAFRRKGYTVVKNGGGGADGGIDLALHKDNKKFYVQCKQWKVYTVGVKPVRELYGVMTASGADGGFFVTSGSYTKDAIEFGRNTPIELIDGPALNKLIATVRNAESSFELSQTKRSDPFVSSGPQDALQSVLDCPFCGSTMVRRTAKKGANAGSQFWGCSTYPKCKGTRD
jgi:restriction system protein